MTPGLTVVIPAYGTTDLLARLLEVLDAQVKAGERQRVIVSDDASPEPLGAALDTASLESLELEVVRSTHNGGPGAARNRGLDRVETPWVAFLDADTVPAPDWLRRLEEVVLAGDESPDVVEGRVSIAEGPPPTPFTHATEITSSAGGQHGGANLLFRTSVLRAVGGFDERFYDPSRKLHFREDLELYFRLEAARTRIAYDADLVAFHPPLPHSFWAPVRLARRYYFDPLLSREHPQRFRELNQTRRLGPLSLRRARHHAALVHSAGLFATALGLSLRRRRLAKGGGMVLMAGWAANSAALSWKRKVRRRDVVPLMVVSAVTPLSYLWHYYRGVVRFGHRARL